MKPNPNKHGLSVRGDSLYCPLPISYDSYWNCLTNCYHCYFRRLNHVWGKELRPSSDIALSRKLTNGINNKNPKSILAWCLSNKKTIRIGNKADPYQKVELKYRITQKAIRVFLQHQWSFVIQTRFTENLLKLNEEDIINNKDLCVIMPVVSPGLEYDWEHFERKRTTPPLDRIKHISDLQKKGVKVGVNGEPFIPGVHKVKDFIQTMKLLKEYNIKSYNTYNFHFNDFVAKRLHKYTDVDIAKIWRYNQDDKWKKILVRLLDIGKKYGIKVGCPDFVNSGNYIEPANTCCGIDVLNPCTYNTHHWKQIQQKGIKTTQELIDLTWDGSGDLKKGQEIIEGTSKEFYTLKDAGLI